ncbi:hypothetical protein [Phosphitispora fastidiosa]|uniref:hypothetical protein n=1 Tax=Phosphitispora fastidiosa TaxID=2837202 RepID=UPI001E2CF269|nr:hypothetical protein [Phosphitispora fastidiosa]MBU7005929.1 hypothetical protein [Phosphitispora fastidiosa]
MQNKNYKMCFDIMELEGLNEAQAYEKGLTAGQALDYRTERSIERARNEVVAFGLLAHERWEKSGEFKYVLLHEYIRGLNHGLKEMADRLTERKTAKHTDRAE